MMRRRYKALERKFPALASGLYERHSPPDPGYNCIAYAAGDMYANWDLIDYWPPGVRKGEKFAKLITAYQTVGFVQCDKNTNCEAGFEKVALFRDKFYDWTHAARMRSDGWWESKLGGREDILHESPLQLEGAEYGVFELCMKRTIAEALRARVEARRRAKARGRLTV